MPTTDWRSALDAGQGERFADGNMTDVVRLGDRVVRSRSPWSEASHAVLRHLGRRGFGGAPRLLDADDDYEVLSFLPGVSIPPSLAGFRDDQVLVTIAGSIRTLHQALEDFQPPPSTAFPEMPGAPQGSAFPCHNDLAPWNTIMRANAFVGFVDWDLVTLATPAWDLAYAAWCFVPLYAEADPGAVEERGRRLRLLLGAYGLPDPERAGFIALIRQRQLCGYRTVEQWGRAGVPGFDRLFQRNLHRGALDDVAWLDRHGDDMQRAIV